MGKSYFLVCGFLKQKAKKRSQHEETTAWARNSCKGLEAIFLASP